MRKRHLRAPDSCYSFKTREDGGGSGGEGGEEGRGGKKERQRVTRQKTNSVCLSELFHIRNKFNVIDIPKCYILYGPILCILILTIYIIRIYTYKIQ